jgi:hypothetical protein
MAMSSWWWLWCLMGTLQASVTLLGTPSLTLLTQDFFQHRTDYSKRTDAIAVDARLTMTNNACTIPPPTQNTLDARETVVVMRLEDRRVCKLVTVSQMFVYARDFARLLPQYGYPNATTLLILLNTKNSGLPTYMPYVGYAGHADNVPYSDLPVAMTASKDAKAWLNATQGRNTVQVTVEHESGPWNDVYFSIVYQIGLYALTIINGAFLLFAAVECTRTIAQGAFKMEFRSAVFLVNFVGMCLYTPTLLMRWCTLTSKLLDATGLWLSALSFHMLMYLWSRFLQRSQLSPPWTIRVFHAVIVSSALVITLVFVSTLTTLFMNPQSRNTWMKVLRHVLSYAQPVVQTLLAVTFLYFAGVFYRRQKRKHVSFTSKYALVRLAKLAVITFVAYIAVAFVNLAQTSFAWTQTPIGYMTIVFVKGVVCSVRGIALLAILGVRVQERSAVVVVSQGSK